MVSWYSQSLVVLVSIAFAVSGCSKKEVTGSVTGKVTLDGKPVPEGCMVNCQHIERGVAAVGKTDANGAYKLETSTGTDILAGEYQVLVQLPLINMDPAEAMRRSQAGTMPKTDESAVPQKYRAYETSGLKMTVKQGSNIYDIPMTP